MKTQEENHDSQHQTNVMLATAKFLSALCLEGEYRDQPDYLSEIFEDILKTEIGDDLDMRTKMIGCIKTSKMLANALEQFTDQQIQRACTEIIEIE
ncbi:hypothetical protein QWY99_00840 [Flavobacterium branchiarum]|uniref:Uncharacterized protein n=1 Tax=Flavobacterium branchiarum TaxID=1114870 RepID=A0ABV5FR33_9FLAO|nr:hypothetical protein [Flavobacterium branchiarum]MDN3671610.1 hypothetical protein [Flavobacterium branchiarum]